MDDVPPPTLEDHFQRLIKASLSNLFSDVTRLVRDVEDVETKCIQLVRKVDEIEERNKKWRETVDVKLDTIVGLLKRSRKDVSEEEKKEAENVWNNLFSETNEKTNGSLPLSIEMSDEEPPSFEMSPRSSPPSSPNNPSKKRCKSFK